MTMLTELFNSIGSGEILQKNYLARKPLSFCLVQCSTEGLQQLGSENPKLSKPMKQLMKLAVDKRKWGGAFNMRECPLCERQNPHGRGCTVVRTAVGSAYLCCASPTKQDLETIGSVEQIRKRLDLAKALDDRNARVTEALAALPDWFKVLSVDSESGWMKKMRADAAAQEASIWGSIIGSVIEGISDS